MKKIVVVLIGVCLLLSLSACSGGNGDTEEVRTETSPAAKGAEELNLVTPVPEKTKELDFEERYGFRCKRDSVNYYCDLKLYPLSGYCEIEHFDEVLERIFLCGSFTKDNEGNISVSIEDNRIGECTIEFSRSEDGLVLESGFLNAWSFDDGGYIELGQGSVFKYYQTTKITAGSYIPEESKTALDTENVLLKLDLDAMSFALRCYDGSVFEGALSFEESLAVLSGEGLEMGFHVYENSAGRVLSVSAMPDVLIYPDVSGPCRPNFVYTEERNEEEIIPSNVVALDSRKRISVEEFLFDETTKNEQGEKVRFSLSIRSYPILGTWEMVNVTTTATENSDGSIVFTDGERSWNFHREGNDLVYDGGSKFIRDSSPEESVKTFEKELPVGTVFKRQAVWCIYDTPYILAGTDGNTAAVRFDLDRRRMILKCSDGTIVEGPITMSGFGTRCLFSGTDVSFTLGQSSIETYNANTLRIAECGDDRPVFIPVPESEQLMETLEFSVKYDAESPSLSEDSILVYEEFFTVAYRAGTGGEFFYNTTVLCPHDMGFSVNNKDSCFYAYGKYTENDGEVTLSAGNSNARLRRGENGLIYNDGDLMRFTSRGWDSEMLSGVFIPLTVTGVLHNGEYVIHGGEGSAYVSFDTETMTFCLTAADGTVYEGNFSCDYKYVHCYADGVEFVFLPTENQVCLDQSGIIKILPDGNDHIYFDYSV